MPVSQHGQSMTHAAPSLPEASNDRHRLMAELGAAPADATLQQRMDLLGIPVSQRSEAVTLAVSVLLETIDDLHNAVAASRREFDELERLVDVDCLAPVPNRRAFMRRLEWAIAMHKRYGHACSLIFFDIHDFKQINDTLGHSAGDAAIRHVADVLSKGLRESDYMARLGGDEFVVLLYHAAKPAAEKRAKALLAALAATRLNWEGDAMMLKAACGVYQLRKGDTADRAIAQADSAMYRDKKRMHQPDMV